MNNHKVSDIATGIMLLIVGIAGLAFTSFPSVFFLIYALLAVNAVLLIAVSSKTNKLVNKEEKK
jgi:uncharacterized membrane protein YbaN (DUF454 family)